MDTIQLRTYSLQDISMQLLNPTAFILEVQGWMRKKEEIIYFKDRMPDNVIIITQIENKYSMYRCFLFVSEWSCSCDLIEKDLPEIFKRIFYLCDRK